MLLKRVEFSGIDDAKALIQWVEKYRTDCAGFNADASPMCGNLKPEFSIVIGGN